MKHSPAVVFLFSQSIVLLAFNGSLSYAQKITTFDVPGGTDTTPTAITSSGEVVGYYADTSVTPARTRSFVRRANGAFTEFDGPNLVVLFPEAVSPSGTIAGDYTVTSSNPPSYEMFGFLRASNGTFTSFSIPAATNLYIFAISPAGVVVGDWIDAGQDAHGFVRQPDGTINTAVNVEGTGFPGTHIVAINPAGAVTGTYNNFSDETRGFVLQPDGTIATFAVLNATATIALAIDARGQVTGYFTGTDSQNHGFLRDTDGQITTFDVRGAISTQPIGIDSKGQIAGVYQACTSSTTTCTGANSVPHGFLRDADGTITTFDVPGAPRTFPVAISSTGEITGVYFDKSGDQHGFLVQSNSKGDDGLSSIREPAHLSERLEPAL